VYIFQVIVVVAVVVTFECGLLQIDNIRLKNADGMPLIMLLGSLMCCSCWFVYGLMLGDPTVYVCIYFYLVFHL